MSPGQVRVLHVLPHPGGGAETYLEQLGGLDGFEFERFELTRHGKAHEVPASLMRLRRALREADLLHVHGDSASLSCLPLLRRRPSVVTLHGSHLMRRRGGGVRAAMRRVFGRVQAAIATSEAELELAREVANPRDADRIELVHNGIAAQNPVSESESESERESVRAALNLGSDAIACLFLGELSERKQPVEFAEAVERVHSWNRDVVGLIAGEGPLKSKLEQRSADGIHLLGQRSDIRELLAACDVFVLPSRWEGLSYAVLEAMAAGRPVIASEGPGNPDAVGDAGLTFPVGDVPALSERIGRLAGDVELRAELGDRAAARVRERFSADAMRDATAGIYGRVLESGG